MIPLLLASLSAPALATTYSTQVCGRLGVSLLDADSAVGDDYMTSSASQPARGTRIKVNAYTSSIPRFFLGEVIDTYASDTGIFTGCLPTSLSLDSGLSYKTVIYSEASVSGQSIEVYTDDTLSSLLAYSSGYYTPGASGTWTTTTASNYEIWNVLAVSSYAAWRNDLGNASEAFAFASDPGTSANTADCDGDTVEDDRCIKIKSGSGDANYERKYLIAHEFSHALLRARYDGSGANYDAAYGACPGIAPASISKHYAVSKEYQGAAFWEGFANYNASAVFNNNTSQTDCTYVTYKDYDFDQDGDNELEDQYLDCAGTPTIDDAGDTPTSFTITDTDYVGTECDAVIGSCSLYNCNRGTEYDWLKFLWHLDADLGFSPDDIGDIYEEARVNGGGYASSGDGTGSGYPGYELQQAAYRLDVTWGWLWGTNYGTYGVYR